MGMGIIASMKWTMRLLFFTIAIAMSHAAQSQDSTIKDSFDANINSWWEGELNGVKGTLEIERA